MGRFRIRRSGPRSMNGVQDQQGHQDVRDDERRHDDRQAAAFWLLKIFSSSKRKKKYHSGRGTKSVRRRVDRLADLDPVPDGQRDHDPDRQGRDDAVLVDRVGEEGLALGLGLRRSPACSTPAGRGSRGAPRAVAGARRRVRRPAPGTAPVGQALALGGAAGLLLFALDRAGGAWLYGGSAMPELRDQEQV